MNCPTCAMPLVWSVDKQRMWCAIYGDHTAPFAGLVRLVMDTPDHSRRGIHNRNRQQRGKLRLAS